MYAIKADGRRTMLRVTISGFLSADDVAGFAEDLREATIAIGCAGGGHVVLVDTRECALQPQEVVGAFRQLLASQNYRARRIALVTGNSVSRMQARRILVDERVRMFECGDEALAWLLAATAPFARAPAQPAMTPMRGY